MSWAAIGTLAAIVAATAAVLQAWTAWKNHQREEARRLSSSSTSTRSRLSASNNTIYGLGGRWGAVEISDFASRLVACNL